jgi:NitT/TauT family transport system permease protein
MNYIKNSLDKTWPYAAFITLWWVVYYFYNNAMVFPSPWEVGYQLSNMVFDDRYRVAVGNTMANLSMSLATALIINLVTVVWAMASDTGKSMVNAYLSMFSPTPMAALLPIFLVLFGVSKTSLMCLIIYSIVTTTLGNMLPLFEGVVQQWKPQVQNLHWSTAKAFKLVYLPAVVPQLLGIVQTSWAQAWRSCLAVEMIFGSIGSEIGITYLMNEQRSLIHTANIWALTMTIMIIGLVVHAGFDAVKSSIKWRPVQ